jgi:hypothetical protein
LKQPKPSLSKMEVEGVNIPMPSNFSLHPAYNCRRPCGHEKEWSMSSLSYMVHKYNVECDQHLQFHPHLLKTH